MTSNLLAILKKKTITDYLERKGHHPVKHSSNGRLFYLCPFPDHKEKKPSFVVWTNADFENFRCFGCLRCYHIVHLVSALENISYREAVKILSEGMEVSLAEDIQLELELIDKIYGKTPERQLSENMMSISSLCLNYLAGVNNDPAECLVFDKFFAVLDAAVRDVEFEVIENALVYLPRVLRLRKAKYKAAQLAKQRQEFELIPE